MPELTLSEVRNAAEWLRPPQDGPIIFSSYNNKLFYTFIVKEGEAYYLTYFNAITGEMEQVNSLYNKPWKSD